MDTQLKHNIKSLFKSEINARTLVMTVYTVTKCPFKFLAKFATL